MQIYLSPQVNDLIIKYTYKGDVITATINDVTDTFDFTPFPDGKIEDVSTIQTTLVPLPIISAERVDGILKVELLNFIGDTATHDECFPVWKEA